jgi:integrase
VAGGWEEALIALALGLSLRRGEALGLRWRDVDFKAGALTVRSQALPLGTGAVEPDQPTKTAASRRRLPLPERVRAALLAQRDRQRLACQADGIQWSEDHFVCEEVGARPRGVASVANVMRRALVAAGLPPMRYHDLRGVCASLLLADGVDIKSVMHILGHADPSLTLAVYARVNPEQLERAGESMGRTLGG